jgi:small-conductance mechanosensitive channel
VIGFASQRTIGNFVAGLLIAFTQPVRLGDRVEIEGDAGVVEEIGLTYTFIRADDDTRLVIPNERLASEPIRNATIRSPRTLAQASVQVPLGADLGRVVELVGREVPAGGDVLVTGLDGDATVTARAWVEDPREAESVASALRLRAHERLREAEVFA